MTAFTFSADQLRSAPPEVQRWIAGEIARTLGAIGLSGPLQPHHEERPAPAMAPAGCTVAEALQIFELVGRDPVVARLFFELARDAGFNTSLPGLHALRLDDLLHHVGLPGRDSLIGGLGAIDEAFRQVNGDRAASLFAFDEAGHLFLHEMTQASIRRVWGELTQAYAAAAREPDGAPAPRWEGFVPPRVGPSEDVAAHAPRSADGADRAL